MGLIKTIKSWFKPSTKKEIDYTNLNSDAEYAIKLEQAAQDAKQKGDIVKYVAYSKQAEEIMLKYL